MTRPPTGRARATTETHGEMLAGISTGLVRLHSRYYGKGPTKAKTYQVNDTVICILRGGFTTVERTLIDDGKSDAVYTIRRSFQQAMEEQFTEVVEGATERKVIACMSQIHADPDLAVEIFVLEPSDEPVAGTHEQDLTAPELDSPQSEAERSAATRGPARRQLANGSIVLELMPHQSTQPA
jgi:uncharacterized protein YbcI